MFNYSVFLLRCRQAKDDIQFRLENPQTNEVFLFTSVSELCHFLAEMVEQDQLTPRNQGEFDDPNEDD